MVTKIRKKLFLRTVRKSQEKSGKVGKSQEKSGSSIEIMKKVRKKSGIVITHTNEFFDAQ